MPGKRNTISNRILAFRKKGIPSFYGNSARIVAEVRFGWRTGGGPESCLKEPTDDYMRDFDPAGNADYRLT